jgi:hypothetical protein
MPTLADLPGEVTTLLAIELKTEDFLNLRLTCKDLNSKSFSQELGSKAREDYDCTFSSPFDKARTLLVYDGVC